VEGSPQVYAFLRESPGDTLLVVLNFAPSASNASVRVPAPVGPSGEWTECFTHKPVRSSGNALSLALEPHGVRVFALTR